MNHKRHRPKNARSGCLMCKPWKVNGASKARAEDLVSSSPGQHKGVCKGPDGWHDAHDWGMPYYTEYDRATHQQYRACNPTTARALSLYNYWERECQRCGAIDHISRDEGRAAYTIGHPYGIPPLKKAS